MDTAKLRAESHTAAASGYCPLGGGFGLRTGLCRIEAGFGERHLPDPWNLGLLSLFFEKQVSVTAPFCLVSNEMHIQSSQGENG